ncbi:hypothetical protein GXW82_36030 [Streptacidiphilus sp. 4-A2]|nr:hypothetical protein [Streptacidiphilus sp. 4-A2]
MLCDQQAAVAAVREARRLSVRYRRRLRRPELLRAWLYALARHSCLSRMDAATRERDRPGRHTEVHARLRGLVWPETAGTSPAQREALELTGRHGLRAEEVAAVLGLTPEQARALLAQAVCEVERTAAALSVLAADGCPELRRLGSERGPVLGPALRGELVRHLDSCPTCRGTAERAAALGPWPGTLRASGTLPLVPGPAELAPALLGNERLLTQLGRREEAAAEPRFDRRGFPVQRSAPSQRAAVLRQRALAGSVIAAVVAAPVVALGLTDHQRHPMAVAPVSSVSVATPAPGPGTLPALPPDGTTPGGPGAVAAGPQAPGTPGAGPAGPTVTGIGTAAAVSSPAASGPAVSATETGGRTVITLTATGPAAVDWQIEDSTPWLRLSRADGTLAAGGQATVLVTVDEAALPVGPWAAQLRVLPSGAVVTLRGPGTGGRRTLPPPVGTPTGGGPTGGGPTGGGPTAPVSSAPAAPPSGSTGGTPTPTPPPSGSGGGSPTAAAPSSPPSASPSASPSPSPDPSATTGTPVSTPSAGTGGGTATAAAAGGRHRRGY